MHILTNDNIKLRALEPEDLPLLYKWENETSLWSIGNTRTPYSKYQIKQYIAQSNFDLVQNGLLKLIIEKNEGKEKIGIIDLFDFDVYHSRIEIGLLIIPTEQQKGYAKQSLQLAENYLFGLLHIHQIYAHITENNDRSKRLFLQNGYKHTCTLKEWIKTNKGYENILCFQKINPYEYKISTPIDSYQ